MKLPEKGTERGAVVAELEELRAGDTDPETGRIFSLVYHASKEIDGVIEAAHRLYMFDNALNPIRYPNLRRMEVDVIQMTADLLNAGDDAKGAITSGGTESILLAVKTARDRARAERGVERPNMVIPHSAHPAFAKGAAYFDLELRKIPLSQDLRADVGAARGLIDDQTALLVGSAPNYPHGVIDPIEDLSGMALEHGIHFHTDCCVGGFLLPFAERLGTPLPPFDFRLPGVSTMSADVHKYGYSSKGASVIVHRDGGSFGHQAFFYDDWPGGIYGSFAMAGTRSGAPIAAAWAVMRYLGVEGYMKLTRDVLDTTRRIREGIEAIDGLRVHGDPPVSVLSFGSDRFDIMAIGDELDRRGWHLDRQQNPDALHMIVFPVHARIVESLLADLRAAVERHGPAEGKEARYS